MSINKYSQLKMAGNLLGFTIKEFAEQNNVSTQFIRMVARDNATSERISKAIDEAIAKADKAFMAHREQTASIG